MSSSSHRTRGMTFSLKLTIWHALVLVLATLALFYALYYLVDNSVDKEWRVTRSHILATWSGDSAGHRSELAIAEQSTVIERTVPGDLNIAMHFQRAFYKVALPILALGLLGGWVVSARGLRPLRDLGRTVRHILATGETRARVPVYSDRGELNELVRLFNQLLDKNDGLMRAMHESLDNVAHDLRTPMTRLRGAAEVVLQEPANIAAYRGALEECMEESDRVLTMLSTLMDVAEAETGAMPLELESVVLIEVVGNVTELYELVAEESSTTLQVDVPEGLRIRADRTRLRQVLANLVDNALKYGREGGEVRIAACERDDRVEISVADQGRGIPPTEIDKIWDRLYRGDLSRTQRGLGLGLSFVKAIAEAHGGSVRVESELGEGSRFIIDWPSTIA